MQIDKSVTELSFSTTRQLARKLEISRRNIAATPGARLRLRDTVGRLGEGGLRLSTALPADGHDTVSSPEPLISVITVVRNGAVPLEETIRSVLEQTYGMVEYILIDGGSSDGTLDVINKYQGAIDYWVSEPDRGLYDAMNKGISLAGGKWLSFMNAGDAFHSRSTLSTLASKEFDSEHLFYYSDVELKGVRGAGTATIHRCDHERRILNHQACVYAKELHSRHGNYLVAKGVTISDYLFFCLLDSSTFKKTGNIIARYDTSGVSQARRSMEQKFVIDYLLGRSTRLSFLAHLNFYHYYLRLRRWIARP